MRVRAGALRALRFGGKERGERRYNPVRTDMKARPRCTNPTQLASRRSLAQDEEECRPSLCILMHNTWSKKVSIGVSFFMKLHSVQHGFEFSSVYPLLLSRRSTHPSPGGVDRLDSNKGYTEENSNPCCTECNFMKNDTPMDTFLLHVSCIKMHEGRHFKPPNELLAPRSNHGSVRDLKRITNAEGASAVFAGSSIRIGAKNADDRFYRLLPPGRRVTALEYWTQSTTPEDALAVLKR